MKILLAADGSKFTKKALAFLAANESLCGPADELLVLHVQPPMPPRVKSMLGTTAIRDYHAEEAAKVIDPIERFLKKRGFKSKTIWAVGSAAEEVLAAALKHKAQMIVMGTHGHGIFGRALLGSVAQKVLTGASIPVLLVK